MATGMIIDGIAASEAIDSSGEILSVEGCDISDLEEGKGVLNWEHRGEDAAGASPNDIVGAIIYAKKIYKAADCEDDRQRMYWDRVKLPLIYVKCRLFDGSGHPGAIALAAMIRDYHANGQPVLVRYSIEGSTLEKEGNHLKRSVARRVAATIKPCNKSCHSGVLEDPNGPQKDSKQAEKDILEDIATRKFEHPSLMRLGGDAEFEVDPVVPETLTKNAPAAVPAPAPEPEFKVPAQPKMEVKPREVPYHQTPEFKNWFGTSKTVHEDGTPMKFYRGVARGGELKGRLDTESYTSSPEIASIYSATPSSPDGMTMEANYDKGAGVFPVHIKMENPVHLKDHKTSFGDVLRALKFGEPNGITQEEAVKMLNHMNNRLMGKVKLPEFEYRLRQFGEDGEEVFDGDPDWEEKGLNFRGGPLSDLRDDFDYAYPPANALDEADKLYADTYAFVDTPRFAEVAKRLGHDGVIHGDIFNGAKHVSEKLIGVPHNEIKGGMVRRNDSSDPNDRGKSFIHLTYRPFHRTHVKSIHNQGTFDPTNEDIGKSELAKTLTAGSTNAAPGTLTGGAALQREEISERAKKIHEMTNTAKAAVRDWDGNGDFKAFLKSRLPEADDEFLDNFADLAEEYKVKKSMQKSEIDLAELQQLAKFDRLALNLNRLLRKAEDENGIEANPEAPKLVRWQGNLMRPGSAIGLAKNNLNKQVKVLGMDDEDVHVQHPDGRIARWPKDGIGTKFKIHELPERVSSPHLVDATKHHVGAPDADQHALVHGIDLGGDGSFDGRPLYGINARTAEYRKHPDGHTVILKDGGPHSPDDPDFLPQHRSAAYYSLAKNFFGLGEHVPPTAVIKHPATGDVMSAMRKVPNATHMGEDEERSTKALHKLGESGQLEKLGLMNVILGNYDRDNIGNFLFTEQHPHLHLIDHDYTFGEFNDVPAYFHRYLSLKHPDKNLFDPRRWQWQLDMAAEPFQEHLHPEATRWAMSLSPDKFAQELVKAGVPDYYRQKALDRLVNLQTRIQNNGGKIKHAEWLKFLGEDPLVRPA